MVQHMANSSMLWKLSEALSADCVPISSSCRNTCVNTYNKLLELHDAIFTQPSLRLHLKHCITKHVTQDKRSQASN